MDHKCQLRRDSISHLPKIFPDAPWIIHLRRKLKKLLLVSIHHPEVFLYLKSNAEVEKESRRQVKHHSGFIIHPLSEFRKFWNIFMFFMMFFHQVLTPFAIGFYVELDNDLDSVILVDMVLCLILFCETLLTFRTGYIIEATNEIILKPRIIARKYLKDFIPDLISCIPFIYLTTWVIEEKQGTINGATVIYMCGLFLFSVWRFNRVLFYFRTVPIMLQLSEKAETILTLCLRSFYW